MPGARHEIVRAWHRGRSVRRSVRIGQVVNYRDRIVRNASSVGREPVFKGARVTLGRVLANLTEGASTAAILSYFPPCQKRTCATQFRLRPAHKRLGLLINFQ